MIKLLIFDFDDTITDNIDLDYYSFRNMGKKLEVKIPSKNEIIKLRKKGLVAKEIVTIILKKDKKEEILSEFLKFRKEFLFNKSSEYLILKKNLKSLLNYLKKKKIKLIICSVNNNKKNVKKFLEKNNILIKFSSILFSTNLGFQIENNVKSNRLLIKSSLLRHIIKTSLISNNEMLFVGNSDEDKIAARKNRIKFVHYQNIYLPKIKNVKSVNTMRELQTMLKMEK